jgi:hypothetical protein
MGRRVFLVSVNARDKGPVSGLVEQDKETLFSDLDTVHIYAAKNMGETRGKGRRVFLVSAEAGAGLI